MFVQGKKKNSANGAGNLFSSTLFLAVLLQFYGILLGHTPTGKQVKTASVIYMLISECSRKGKELRAVIQSESFTTVAMDHCEHRCLWAVGPVKTTQGTVVRQYVVCYKMDKGVLLLERTRCVKFPKSGIAESI